MNLIISFRILETSNEWFPKFTLVMVHYFVPALVVGVVNYNLWHYNICTIWLIYNISWNTLRFHLPSWFPTQVGSCPSGINPTRYPTNMLKKSQMPPLSHHAHDWPVFILVFHHRCLSHNGSPNQAWNIPTKTTPDPPSWTRSGCWEGLGFPPARGGGTVRD